MYHSGSQIGLTKGPVTFNCPGAGIFAGGGHKSFLKKFAGVTIFGEISLGGHQISGGAFSVPGTPNAARGLADGQLRDLVCVSFNAISCENVPTVITNMQ